MPPTTAISTIKTGKRRYKNGEMPDTGFIPPKKEHMDLKMPVNPCSAMTLRQITPEPAHVL
jgi:hypothetical protein